MFPLCCTCRFIRAWPCSHVSKNVNVIQVGKSCSSLLWNQWLAYHAMFPVHHCSEMVLVLWLLTWLAFEPRFAIVYVAHPYSIHFMSVKCCTFHMDCSAKLSWDRLCPAPFASPRPLKKAWPLCVCVIVWGGETMMIHSQLWEEGIVGEDRELLIMMT